MRVFLCLYLLVMHYLVGMGNSRTPKIISNMSFILQLTERQNKAKSNMYQHDFLFDADLRTKHGAMFEPTVSSVQNMHDGLKSISSLCCDAEITEDGFCQECKEHTGSIQDQELWERRNQGKAAPVMQEVFDSIIPPLF